jgi:DNA-binding Lrp family transcriptional regulator
MIKDLQDVMNFLMELEEEFKDIIKDYKISLSLRIYKLHDITLNEEDSKPIELDATDLKILKYISENAVAKIKDISKNLKLHRNTVSKKLAKFWKEKVLLKKSVRVPEEYLPVVEKGLGSIIEIEFVPGYLDALAKALCNSPEIHELYLTEENQLIAVAMTKDLASFYNMHRKLRNEYDEYILRSVSNIILKSTSKDSRKWFYDGV